MVNKLFYKNNTFYKFDYIFYFLFFILIGLYLNLNDYVELATNDDRTLWDLLINGEKGTLILSYPLSSIFVKLYHVFPDIQWYSFLLTTLMLMNSLFFALYISMQKQTSIKVLLFILFSIFLINYWVNLSITLLTVSLLVNAILFIQHKFSLFIAILIAASFLRTGMVVTFLPLIILSVILLYKFPFKKLHIIFSILFFSILAVNVMAPKVNLEYSNWLAFNKAKSYFIDLHKGDQNNILTEEQNKLLKLGWWIQDEDLLPASQLKKSAGSRVEVLKDSMEKFNIKYFNTHRYKHIIYLLLITIIVLGIIRKKYFLIYLLLFSAIIFVIFTKDVERTTMPLLFLLLVTIFASFNRITKNKNHVSIRYTFLGLSILILMWILPGNFSNRDKYYNEIKPLKKEFLNLLISSKKECEMSINFPTPFRPAASILMGNKLFDEKHWISFKYTPLLPTGWLSRHPFFYKSHQISTSDNNRKYKNYYDFLINNDTAFIASRGLVRNDNSNNILSMYDNIYNKNNKCKHETTIIKESNNFAISQVRNRCENINLLKQFSERGQYLSPIAQQIDLNSAQLIFNIKDKIENLTSNNHVILTRNENTVNCNVSKTDPIIILNNIYSQTEYVRFHLYIESTQNTKLQLYYKNEPTSDYIEFNSHSTTIENGLNKIDVLIPSRYINNGLRIDMADKIGIYKIHDLLLWNVKLYNSPQVKQTKIDNRKKKETNDPLQ